MKDLQHHIDRRGALTTVDGRVLRGAITLVASALILSCSPEQAPDETETAPLVEPENSDSPGESEGRTSGFQRLPDGTMRPSALANMDRRNRTLGDDNRLHSPTDGRQTQMMEMRDARAAIERPNRNGGLSPRRDRRRAPHLISEISHNGGIEDDAAAHVLDRFGRAYSRCFIRTSQPGDVGGSLRLQVIADAGGDVLDVTSDESTLSQELTTCVTRYSQRLEFSGLSGALELSFRLSYPDEASADISERPDSANATGTEPDDSSSEADSMTDGTSTQP